MNYQLSSGVGARAQAELLEPLSLSHQHWQDQSEVRMGCEGLGPPIYLHKSGGPMWKPVPILSTLSSQCSCPLLSVAVTHL